MTDFKMKYPLEKGNKDAKDDLMNTSCDTYLKDKVQQEKGGDYRTGLFESSS